MRVAKRRGNGVGFVILKRGLNVRFYEVMMLHPFWVCVHALSASGKGLFRHLMSC